jgi:hypothetical protein
MRFIIDFFKQAFQLIQSQSLDKESKDSKEDAEVKDAYQWFIKKLKENGQKELAESNDPYFLPGKIYIFKYEPEQDKHPYFDKHPIALMLGKAPAKEGMMNVCINLSWYPPKARKYILDKIALIYKSTIEKEIKKSPKDAKKQRAIENIDLYALKENLDAAGFSWAIRCYLPSRVKSPKIEVAYEHWDKVVRLDQPRIFPEIQGPKAKSLMEIYREFEMVYLKRQSNNKGEIKKKRDEAKKQNRYKFIK